MEELSSLWSYQESIEEVKQKLLFTTLELESVKMEASEETRKNKENVKNLLHLLEVANQERDEARNQLQKIINKMTPNLLLLPESPTIIIPPTTTKANSSITESNSLSETHNSSHVDSFFDSDSSPDFSNIHMDSTQMYHFVPAKTDDDPATAIIDNFVKGKALPQKGKLLQSVMEAGPLLQTLLVAGPLPRWRNPPPLQPFKIPPVSIKGCDENKGILTSGNNSISSFPYYGEISRGNPQMCSAAMLNFNGGGGPPASSASCYGNNGLMVGQSPSTNYYHQPPDQSVRFPSLSMRYLFFTASFSFFFKSIMQTLKLCCLQSFSELVGNEAPTPTSFKMLDCYNGDISKYFQNERTICLDRVI